MDNESVPEVTISVAGDPLVACSTDADASVEQQCHCYLGFHYIGQMCWNEETGEEVEVHFPVACKRCSA